MVTRLCKEYNDAHPNWQATGGDDRSARFEYLPEKVAPCGRSARRHHGAKTGPPNGATAHAAGGGGEETCDVSGLAATGLHYGKLMFSFLNCLSSVTSRSGRRRNRPRSVLDAELLDRGSIGVYNGFDLPMEERWSWVTISKLSTVPVVLVCMKRCFV